MVSAPQHFEDTGRVQGSALWRGEEGKMFPPGPQVGKFERKQGHPKHCAAREGGREGRVWAALALRVLGLERKDELPRATRPLPL